MVERCRCGRVISPFWTTKICSKCYGEIFSSEVKKSSEYAGMVQDLFFEDWREAL